MRYLLAVIAFFAAAVPALATTQNTKVDDDFFDPGSSSVGVGDTINWHWVGTNDHTVTTHARQIDRFDSGIHNKGAKFSHLFKYAGRYRYFCQIHPGIMESTVTVGTDDGVAPKITRLRARPRGSRVKLSFRLSERSLVTAKVKGAKKVVKVFGRGKHSVRIKGLDSGRHTAALSAKDGFGHTGKKSKRFRTR